jgi:hypothetical protein
LKDQAANGSRGKDKEAENNGLNPDNISHTGR